MIDREVLAEAACEYALFRDMLALCGDDGDPMSHLTTEHQNALSGYAYALKKDTPAKTWFYAEVDHAAIYRALRIDADDNAAFYATGHLRLAKIDDAWHILAAYPAPQMLPEIAPDWLDIETVIAWNPVTNRAHVLGDPVPQLVGAFQDEMDAGVIYADPFAFLRSWVEARAAFWTEWRASHGQAWRAVPNERDTVPGCLMIGKDTDIRWPVSSLPKSIATVGHDPDALFKAIFRAAKLPRVHQKAA
jgi:hypothetical protein